MKEVDTIFCSVWSEPDSLHGFVVWIIFLVVPVILGPVLTSVLEMLHSQAEFSPGASLTAVTREPPAALLGAGCDPRDGWPPGPQAGASAWRSRPPRQLCEIPAWPQGIVASG